MRLFGSIREAVGAGELEIALAEGACVADLRGQLEREHAAFGALGARLRVAVNRELAPEACRLTEGDEVAFLPPVAGGAQPQCTLSQAPLVADEVALRAGSAAPAEMGGIVTFVGAVRGESRGQRIRHLEYEAYPGMAEQAMQAICDEAAAKWPGVRVAMAHRTGRLAVGDLAVVVSAAAPHRAEAFEACRFAIDALKERVPIWKKEVAVDGAWWVEDTP